MPPSADRTTNLKSLFGAGIAIIGLATVILPSAAEASTVLIDEGGYTYDSTSGLDWLDITATRNLSYSQVLANDGVSYVADGWHYATVTQILDLLQGQGFSFTHQFDNYLAVGYATELAGLFDLFGATFTSDNGTGFDAFFAGTTPGLIGTGNFELGFVQGIATLASLNDNTGTSGSANPTYGSFLVRDHVSDVAVTPLPAALPMFAAATGLLSFLDWKRRKTQAR